MGPATLSRANYAPSVWGGPIAVRTARTDPWNSDISTADTLGILRRHVAQYAADPFVLAGNAHALAALPPHASDRDIAGAIFHWVRQHVRFVEDERLMYEQLGVAPDRLDKELLLVPPTLLSMPQPMGDCDDFSLLIACMLRCAGIRPFFVTVAADASDPRKFSHIYVAAQLADEGGYLCLDAGNRLAAIPPGWEISNVTRKAIWAV
jgi:hypothetical protein